MNSTRDDLITLSDYAWQRSRLAATTDASLAEPIGPVGGIYADGTRRASRRT